LLSLWSRVAVYFNVLALPLRNRFSAFFPALTNHDNSANLNSSPINYNRTYVSNYLDQYSDDDTNDVRLLSCSSFDSSLSNEEEFQENLRFVINHHIQIVNHLSSFFIVCFSNVMHS